MTIIQISEHLHQFKISRRFLWVMVALIVGSYCAWHIWQQARGSSDTLILIIPDQLPDTQTIYVDAWRDASNEEGVPLRILTASEFSHRSAAESRHIRGIILPDTFHRQMSDAFITHVKKYIASGGALLLFYDAGALDMQNKYPSAGSRFGDLLGMNFMDYQRLREALNQSITVHGAPDFFQQLLIPPGRYRLEPEYGTARAVITGYQYDALRYPTLTIQGEFNGTTLLESADHQFVAGQKQFGKGSVVFVNLPATYLKLRTDGMWLHGWLRYFATQQRLPHLSSVPEGVGGLTLNWHCDAKICEPALEKLMTLGFFKQGPYSFHVTAGPDQRAIGDGLGLNIPNNTAMQALLKKLQQDGHTIGSHGGWIHDYFGANLPQKPDPQFTQLLVQNKSALEAVTGKIQTEYSAPMGNQPQWVTDWLAEQNAQAYYITANMGMGPTRTYHDGVRDDTLWSFPVQNYGRITSVEEAFRERIPEAEIGDWLEDMVRFVVQQRTSRLIYFHPPGATLYPNAVFRMLEQTAAHQTQGQFRWRTMTELAQFLDRREQTQWTFKAAPKQTNTFILQAQHEWTLDKLTWEFPKNQYQKPVIQKGQALIRERNNVWQVIAADGQSLTIRISLNNDKS